MQQAEEFRPISIAEVLPSTAEAVPHTFQWFKQMREYMPIFQDPQTSMWQVFRYDDVSTILKDPARFSSRSLAFEGTFAENTLVTTDPPDHRKLRNLVNLAFTPRAVARLEGRIAEITQELLNQVRTQGTIDIVSDMAFPLPARVIAEMLGVAKEDWDIFQRWAGIDSASPIPGDNPLQIHNEMLEYFARLLEERRRAPREDLITALSLAEIGGERLTEQELVSFCILLLAAGQDTTKNLISNFMLTLSDLPEDYAQLARDPSLIPTAIEELLRYFPPAWFVVRQTTTEVELHGVHIPANHMVMPWLASANRDAAQFPNPDHFDIRREPNRHLAFGHGIHFCVGAPLARLEAKVVLPMMLEQLQDFQVVKDTPINIRPGLVLAITNLPATFKPY